MMGFGLLFTVLGLVALAYMLGWRPQNSGPARKDASGSALDVLNARYARGEISKTAYEKMRQDLAV